MYQDQPWQLCHRFPFRGPDEPSENVRLQVSLWRHQFYSENLKGRSKDSDSSKLLAPRICNSSCCSFLALRRAFKFAGLLHPNGKSLLCHGFGPKIRTRKKYPPGHGDSDHQTMPAIWRYVPVIQVVVLFKMIVLAWPGPRLGPGRSPKSRRRRGLCFGP